MNLALLGRLDRVDGLTSGRYLLHFLAGLDIFRRGWVLCARVGHEECTLWSEVSTLNSFGVLDATMYNLLVTRLVVSLVRYRHLAYQ